jgi:hypothetical protein
MPPASPLRIGIDFDNTIVSYDALFHRAAVDRGLVQADLPPNKLAVRDHLRRIGREDDWTELQGYVYGPRIAEAAPFPGAIEFFRWARDAGIDVRIVSHRTKHPFIGPQHDLHAAARGWVTLFLESQGLIRHDQAFFELTKAEKVARIASTGCTHFIDDLPEILLADGFPASTQRILFDPEGHHAAHPTLQALGRWDDIRRHFEQLWAPAS